MATNENGHRSDEITAYLSETLEPEEKAAFEAHLATCEECQDELAAQRELFGQVNEVLAVRRKRSIDEQVARFEKIVAAERPEARAEARPDARAEAPAKSSSGGPMRSRRYQRWAIPAVVALAASAAAVVVVVGHLGSGLGPDTMAQQGTDAGADEPSVAAPRKPKADAGVDGGEP